VPFQITKKWDFCNEKRKILRCLKERKNTNGISKWWVASLNTGLHMRNKYFNSKWDKLFKNYRRSINVMVRGTQNEPTFLKI